MTNYLIDFSTTAWESPSEGVSQKTHSDGQQRIRLIKFKYGFIEKEWCKSGHLGYVLAGEMKINFDGEIKFFKKGDGLWIEKGEQSKHKVIIEKGKFVELVLFEDIL